MNIWKYIFEYLMQAIPLSMTFLYGSTGEILTEVPAFSTSGGD